MYLKNVWKQIHNSEFQQSIYLIIFGFVKIINLKQWAKRKNKCLVQTNKRAKIKIIKEKKRSFNNNKNSNNSNNNNKMLKK